MRRVRAGKRRSAGVTNQVISYGTSGWGRSQTVASLLPTTVPGTTPGTWVSVSKGSSE